MAKQFWKPGNMLYPVPAVMVSCQSKQEKPNIITVAWTATVNTVPPMLSISIRPERYSYSIIRDTKEFAVNLVTENLLQAADFCGVKSGRDTDKFYEMKLTPFPSKEISAPGIAESPVIIECKVRQIVPLGSHDLFLAEVVGVTIEDDLLQKDGRFDLNAAKLVAYSHGEYFELGKKLGKFGYSVKKTGSGRLIQKEHTVEKGKRNGRKKR